MINLDVVAYINGVLFHPRSVSLTATAGQTLRFALDVTPVAEWAMLPPRSHVAVFFTDPVTQVWRLLCEGEYTGMGRSKVATGARSRQLICRGLSGFWDTTPFVNLFGAVPERNIPTRMATAQAQGLAVSSTGSDTAKLSEPVANLRALLARIGAGNFPSFLRRVTLELARQANVEAFYARERKLDAKFEALPDPEIDKYVNAALTADLIKNGLNAFGLTSEMRLSVIVNHYESIAFYTHTPIPAPPGDEHRIREVLFTPVLNNVVAPACNVIFSHQITLLSAGLDYTSQPTRALVTVDYMQNGTLNDIPVVYMANGLRREDYEVGREEPQLTAIQKTVYSLLSPDELEAGVVAHYQRWPIERIQPSTAETSSMKDYLNALARYIYDNARASARDQDVQASFLPYAVPGFPCVVEDGDTPLYGYLESVTHQIPAGGTPSTSLRVVRVRELYAQDGAVDPPLPLWLNAAYTPAKIADTYRMLFGPNLIGSDGYAAAVPDKVLVTKDGKSLSMAELMGTIVNVPSYAKNGQGAALVKGGGEATMRLALSASPQRMAFEYQYRSGTTLEDFCRLHKLVMNGPLPELLFERGVEHPLFAAPAGLRFTTRQDQLPPEDTGNNYGFYELAADADGKTLSSRRQDVALAIAAAIARGITDDTR